MSPSKYASAIDIAYHAALASPEKNPQVSCREAAGLMWLFGLDAPGTGEQPISSGQRGLETDSRIQLSWGLGIGVRIARYFSLLGLHERIANKYIGNVKFAYAELAAAPIRRALPAQVVEVAALLQQLHDLLLEHLRAVQRARLPVLPV